MELKDFTTRNLAEELQRRSKIDEDIETVVSWKSSSSWVVSVGGNEPLIGKGEVMVIAVKGLF